MRDRTMRIKGTVNKRPSGRYTAVVPLVYDPRRGRKVRDSLGTFDAWDEAVDALTQHISGTDGRRGRAVADILTLGLDSYLSTWVAETLRPQEAVGDIARSTRRDYEDTLRRYVVPFLDNYRTGDLSVHQVRAWIRTLRTRDLSDRTVQKAWRALHKALADSDLPTNPAALSGKDRPRVRRTRVVLRPTVDEVNSFLAHVTSCRNPGGHRPPTIRDVWIGLGGSRPEVRGARDDGSPWPSQRPTRSLRRGAEIRRLRPDCEHR